jgi:hypothetical protein
MKTPLFPSSRSGKAAAWLLLVSAALFLLFYVFGELVPVLPDIIITFLGPLPLLGLLVGGVLALVRLLKHERAILLTLAVAAGLLELVMFALIILFPE